MKYFLPSIEDYSFHTHQVLKLSNFNFFKMSSNADFVSAQRRLLNLHENGHNMTQDQMVRALDGLLGVTQQMVRNRREEIRNQVSNIPTRPRTPPRTPPATPPHQRPVTPPGTPPAIVRRNWPNLAAASAADYLRAGDYEQAREAIGRAERADAARYTGPVRPSALLREINEDRGVIEFRRRRQNIDLVNELLFAEDAGETEIADEIIQEIRDLAAPPVRRLLGQRRDWMSWQFYAPVHIKNRAIGQARFEANCTEACAICLDTHTNGDSVVTQECNHCFGKECWKTWMCNPYSNQTCPTCRTDRPNVIAYTMRRPRANAVVEEDDVISLAAQEI
jgi:hypothetical protein